MLAEEEVEEEAEDAEAWPRAVPPAGAAGAQVGHTELGKEEMTPPLKPRPASRVLVTTEATVAWLPLDEGPMPVAMETKEKGSPDEVQVEEPEEMGAMSAEEAGETVGWEGARERPRETLSDQERQERRREPESRRQTKRDGERLRETVRDCER